MPEPTRKLAVQTVMVDSFGTYPAPPWMDGVKLRADGWFDLRTTAGRRAEQQYLAALDQRTAKWVAGRG